MSRAERHHATCVQLGARGVLLRGASGSGKSDLAWRLLQAPWSGRLVADDQTEISVEDGILMARAPLALQGLMELRGLGLLRVPFAACTALHLVVDLVSRGDVPRLPEPSFAALCGLDLPRIALHAFDLTAPDKVRLAADFIAQRGFPGDEGIIGQLD
jgi:serine kinase of HPr protein (carbohydrate metabolism regulator)